MPRAATFASRDPGQTRGGRGRRLVARQGRRGAAGSGVWNSGSKSREAAHSFLTNLAARPGQVAAGGTVWSRVIFLAPMTRDSHTCSCRA